ncbi:MAG: flagellar basal body P-ring protein FlgI [Planctomycetaceae bacterium]|jgi:flagellar P-ring protein precursor FlgI|nr:flagellar basal body P-ring protein FlgI [Phycisphaerales bacterium]MCE2652263.1 flagellar basal body P-ring protein FlgI [Planctomycetaceae bacterium]
MPPRARQAHPFRPLLCALALSLLALPLPAGAQTAPRTDPVPLTPGYPPLPPGAIPEPASTFADLVSVQDVARIEGQGVSILRGVGIVTGLRGTGDSGSELALARPLAKIYESNENPLADLRELAKAKSAALVMLEVTIPAKGAVRDDQFHVQVSASHSATSLAGGRLHLAALSGPLPGQGVYAMASGAITIEDPNTPTVGVVRNGAVLIEDIRMPPPTSTFNLILQPQYRHFTVADQLADAINALTPDSDDPSAAGAIAKAVDHMTLRVTIPAPERAAATKFISRVMAVTFSPSLLRQPAEVRINQRTGTVIATAEVEISAVAISHKDINIQMLTPAAQPNAINPAAQRTSIIGMTTTTRPSDRARLQDLLAAFRQMDVPIDSQIAVITELHRTGRLHANLIFE